jgi:hypothetical protein
MVYERALNNIKQEGITLEAGLPVAVEVTVSKRAEGESPRLSVEKLTLLAEAPQMLAEELYIHLPPECSSETLQSLAALLGEHEGEVRTIIAIMRDDDSVVYIESRKDTAVTWKLLQELDKMLGKGRYKLKIKPCAPPPRRWVKPPQETQVVMD